MELLTVLLIFDLLQRTIKPRLDAFDKCRVLEIENSALFPAFRFQDIKDIKRETVQRIQTVRVAFASNRERAAVAVFCERTIESSAKFPASAQRAERSRERTEGLRPQGAGVGFRRQKSRFASVTFDYFLEIKNSALFLAFCLQEIKEIKEIKRRARRSSRPRCRGRAQQSGRQARRCLPRGFIRWPEQGLACGQDLVDLHLGQLVGPVLVARV